MCRRFPLYKRDECHSKGNVLVWKFTAKRTGNSAYKYFFSGGYVLSFYFLNSWNKMLSYIKIFEFLCFMCACARKLVSSRRWSEQKLWGPKWAETACLRLSMYVQCALFGELIATFFITDYDDCKHPDTVYINVSTHTHTNIYYI